MAKKLETVRLIAGLEKASREAENGIWADIAKRLSAPRRNHASVNLDKLNSMAKKFKGKTMVVPGKVLSKGELTEKVKIVAVTASEGARKKIGAKGEFIPLKDFILTAEKAKAASIVIVK